MKLKKVIQSTLALGIAVSMLAGCAQKENRETSKNNSNESKKSASDLSLTEHIKTKYAKDDMADYEEPIYNLPDDYVFKFDNLSKEYFELDECECVKVFSDSALTQYVDINLEEDYETMSMTVEPGVVFNFADEDTEEQTWGSYSKFWLVKYYDMETGKKYETPKVTVFTIKRDLTAPTLKQSVQSDGLYRLDWSDVEGADYYEVYEYYGGSEHAGLEFTTEETSCNYMDLKTAKDYEEHWDTTYEDTEVDTDKQWLMNTMLDMEYSYFVVAKTDDGKISGMSNLCDIKDIAGQIPRIYSDSFITDYEGNDILALPAYVDIEMLDGSVGKFVIKYTGATITLLEDKRIMVEPSVMNLPIEMMQIFFSGMEWEDFKAQEDKLKDRENKLASQPGTPDVDVDIPYVPDNKEENVGEESTKEESTKEKKTEEESTEEETEEEESTEEETVEEESTEKESNGGIEKENIDTKLEDTIYANTALSEWIALNMLNHSESISLEGFNEASDSEYLLDAVFEASTQNPLIGILDSISYDYDENSLLVEYGMSGEDTEAMQDASIKKAAEISKEIIKDGMSDYEKEETINEYICKNASYNEEILEYIHEDGTIDEECVDKFSSSFTPYGILVENYGVCESYAEAFLMIAREAGLEAIIETGRMENVNHEWNRVKIDGSWYTLDVTNNDNDLIPNCYFNLPDELASQILKEDGDAFIDSYIANYQSEGMEQEYYTIKGLYTEDGKKASEMIAKQLKDKKNGVIRMDVNYGNSDIMEIVQDALGKAGIDSAMYYYNAGVIAVVKE